MHVLHAFMLCLRFVLVDLCMQICPSLVHLCMLRMRPLTTYISACSILVMPAPDAFACVSIGTHAIWQAIPPSPTSRDPFPVACCARTGWAGLFHAGWMSCVNGLMTFLLPVTLKNNHVLAGHRLSRGGWPQLFV
jgi:hypothetical protein